MPRFGPWPGVPSAGGGALAEWFLTRFARARTLIPAANFDSIIGEDFGQTVTSELADTVGTADASPVEGRPSGVISVTVGDPVIALSSGRVQLVGSPSHVEQQGGGAAWYMASLAKYVGPLDLTQLGQTSADMIGLWDDAGQRVMLGVRGNASGGSTTNWVGTAIVDSSESNVTGPLLDSESAVWHLFEAWYDTTNLFFAVDGTTFTGIQTAQMSTEQGRLGMTVERSAVGDPAVVLYDKACVIVASPTVGEG